MNRISKQIAITAAAGALLCSMAALSGNALADETAGQKIDRVAQKTAGGIRKGAEWTGNGIRKGVTKAGEGISKGVTYAAGGIRKAAQKTGEGFEKVGNKLQQSAS